MNDSVKTAWEQLGLYRDPPLAELFRDEGRVPALSTRFDLPQGGGIVFDWSKTHLTAELLADFEKLAQAAGFAEARRALFAGEEINSTEGRAAEHSAQRGIGKDSSVEEAQALHLRMKYLVEAIHQGALGEVKHLIHVGIGGSALGPAMAVDALARDLALVDVHVVSNIDGCALEEAFAACDPVATPDAEFSAELRQGGRPLAAGFHKGGCEWGQKRLPENGADAGRLPGNSAWRC